MEAIPKHIRGAVFDVDETLLDNSLPNPEDRSIHNVSGRQAYKIVGEKYDYQYMTTLTTEENEDAFKSALSHSAEAGAWEILVRAGAIDRTLEFNLHHPILREILIIKDRLQEEMIAEYGRPIRGADHFIRALGEYGLEHKLSIASTGARKHIDVFLRAWQLKKPYFPTNHIIAKENVRNFKPDPEAFEKGYKRLRLDDEFRHETLGVEDSIKGIASAKKVGLFVCALTTSFSEDELRTLPKDVRPDLIVDDYAELAAELNIPMSVTGREPTQAALPFTIASKTDIII